MRAFKPPAPLGIRREAENGPSGLWEPKGGADRGKPAAAGRPRNRPRLRQGQNLRSGCPWAAPGTPESHFPAPEGLKGRLDLERGWKRRPERTPGKPGRRALGRTGGREGSPAPGDLGKAKAAQGRTGDLGKAKAADRRGKYIRRCPETGRTGPGRGENPRKSEAKRLNDIKTAVTLLVTSIALFRTRPPGSRPWQFSLIPGPALGLPGTAGVPADHAGKAADRRAAHLLRQDPQHRRPPAPGNPEGQPGDPRPGQTEGPQRGGRDHPPGAHAESRARPNPREQKLPYNERKQDRTLPQKTRAPRKGAANNPRWRSRY